MFGKLAGALKKAGAGLLGRTVDMIPGVAQGKAILGMIADVVNINSEDPDVLADAIAADPELALKLKQLEADEQQNIRALSLEFQRLQIENERIQAADRDSARQRSTAVVQATGKADTVTDTLSFCLFGLFAAVLVLSLVGSALGYKLDNVDSLTQNIILMLVTGLVGEFRASSAYRFGKADADRAWQAMSANGNGDSEKPWETDEPVEHMSVKELRECVRSPECPDALKQRAKERLKKDFPGGQG